MIPILFEDKHIIVVNKPSNMPSQRDFSRSLDLESVVTKHIGSKAFLIHRLDRHVSGPIVLSKTKESAKGLNSQMAKKGFEKVYQAVVLLPLDLVYEKDGSENELIHYIKKEKGVAKTITFESYNQMTKENKEQYKKAVLSYRVKEIKEIESQRVGLVEIKLITGRFHQIRSQLSKVGMPILGDPKYGITQFENRKYSKIGLQCIRLGFVHPLNKKRIELDSYHHEEPFDLFI